MRRPVYLFSPAMRKVGARYHSYRLVSHPAMTTTLNHPHLAALAEELELTLEHVRTMQASYNSAQLAWQPGPKRWSVLECMEHLRIVHAGYLPRIRETIAASPSSGADLPFKPGWFAKLFIGFVSPEVKRKLKAPGAFTAEAKGGVSSLDPSVIDAVLEQGAVFHQLIIATDQVNMNAVKFASPLTRLVRFTPGEGLTMLIRHMERHVLQAARVTQETSFPSA